MKICTIVTQTGLTATAIINTPTLLAARTMLALTQGWGPRHTIPIFPGGTWQGCSENVLTAYTHNEAPSSKGKHALHTSKMTIKRLNL